VIGRNVALSAIMTQPHVVPMYNSSFKTAKLVTLKPFYQHTPYPTTVNAHLTIRRTQMLFNRDRFQTFRTRHEFRTVKLVDDGPTFLVPLINNTTRTNVRPHVMLGSYQIHNVHLFYNRLVMVHGLVTSNHVVFYNVN
jgi:hypothetical protein